MKMQHLEAFFYCCVLASVSYASPCNSTNSALPFCNTSLPINDRVADLLGRLSALEYPGLLGNTAAGAQSIGMSAYQWWSEALHGVANSPGVTYGGDVPCSTSFPQVCTTAASFNRSLFGAIGNTVGKEARAMNNAGHAGLTFWAPNVNIFRDPRWGRGQETPGEDPYLTSIYAVEFVKSMQINAMDPKHLRVSSCCKHYAGYDMENSGGYDRFNFNAVINDYDMNNTYLPAFEACYHQSGGGASSMMCSYNAVNGVPSCANTELIEKLARNTWGFDGYVTSDCGAIQCIWQNHKYTSTGEQTVGVAMRAGVDLDCGSLLSQYVLPALLTKDVTTQTIEASLNHTFRTLMRLGYFDPVSEQPYKTLGPSDINTPQAQKLAEEAALEGIVLLNYNTSYLPWDKTKVHHVAVLGPNANQPQVLLGNYYGLPPYIITPLQGVSEIAAQVSFMAVLNSVGDESTANFSAACQLIKSADTALLVIGNDQSVESEGNDRTSIALPGSQDEFVRTMAECAFAKGKQVTVVVLSGGSVDYSLIKAQLPRGVGGIFWAGYPGQAGGRALAKLLFGVQSPSGRLPHTVYPSEYIHQVSMLDMQMTANSSTGNPGRTYKYYTGTPVYPFAWGLTYTTWELVPLNGFSTLFFNEPNAKSKPMTSVAVGQLKVNVTNTGTRASAFSVLFKITPLNPGPDIGGALSDFKKVFLQPGESCVVTLGANAHCFVAAGSGHYKWVLNEGSDEEKSGVFSFKRV